MELDKKLLQGHIYDRIKSALIFLDPDEKVLHHLEELGYRPQRKRIYIILELSQIPPSKIHEFLDIKPVKNNTRVEIISAGKERRFLITKETDTQSRHQIPESGTRYQNQTPARASAHKLFMNKRLLCEVLLNNINNMEYDMLQSLHSFLFTDGKYCRVKRTIRLPKSMYNALMCYIKAINKKFSVELTFNDLVELTLPLWIESLRKPLNTNSTGTQS